MPNRQEQTAQRFRREAKLGASLNHPNMVAVYRHRDRRRGVLIVMEYVDGETLRDAIGRGRSSRSGRSRCCAESPGRSTTRTARASSTAM